MAVVSLLSSLALNNRRVTGLAGLGVLKTAIMCFTEDGGTASTTCARSIRMSARVRRLGWEVRGKSFATRVKMASKPCNVNKGAKVTFSVGNSSHARFKSTAGWSITSRGAVVRLLSAARGGGSVSKIPS